MFLLSLAAIVMASSASAGTVLIGDLTETAPSVTPSGGASLSGISCSVTANVERCNFEILGPVGAASFSTDFQQVNMFDQGSSVVSDLLQLVDNNNPKTF
jgi:hypothetical protein